MANLSALITKDASLDAPNVRGCSKSSLSLDFEHVLTFGLKRDIGALWVQKKGVLFYLGRVPSYFYFLLPRFFIGRYDHPGIWSIIRSTERKSSPVLKTPRTLQSQLNNGFCRQRWANYHLAVLVQPPYVHTCGRSTVNLANLVFFRHLKCQNFGIWWCP